MIYSSLHMTWIMISTWTTLRSDKLSPSSMIESKKSSRISTGNKRLLTSGMMQLSKKALPEMLYNYNKSLHRKTKRAYIHTVSITYSIIFIIIPIESNMSRRTAASGASFKKRVAAEKKEQGENAEWDRSTVASDKK